MNKKELLLGKVLGPVLIFISIFFLFAGSITTVNRRDQRDLKDAANTIKQQLKYIDEDDMEDYLDDAGIHDDVDDFIDDVKDFADIMKDGSFSASEVAFNTGILKKLYKVFDEINDDYEDRYDSTPYDDALETLNKVIWGTRLAKLLFFLTIIAAVYGILMMYCGRRLAAIAPVVVNALWFIGWIVVVFKINDESSIDFRITAAAVLPLIFSIVALILGIVFNTTEGPVTVDQLKTSFSGAAAAAGSAVATAGAAATSAATNAAASINAQYQQAQQQYQAQQQAQMQPQQKTPATDGTPCFCGKCGTKYEPGAKFCGGCGNKLS